MVGTVLSLCDFTGAWSQPYADAGYNVVRVDTQLDGSDVRLLHRVENVVGVLAAPPCTVFANSGARWPRTDDDMREGLSIVDACIRIAVTSGARWWALENPVGKLSRYLGRPAMYFQPHHYAGHADDPASEAYTKRTGLWGVFNTSLPLANVEPRLGSVMHTRYGGGSIITKNARSKTPTGFARAFFQANP